MWCGQTTLITRWRGLSGEMPKPEASSDPEVGAMMMYLSTNEQDSLWSHARSRDMAGGEGRGPILHVPPSKHGDALVARKRKQKW